jgi:hypothetical protein
MTKQRRSANNMAHGTTNKFEEMTVPTPNMLNCRLTPQYPGECYLPQKHLGQAMDNAKWGAAVNVCCARG